MFVGAGIPGMLPWHPQILEDQLTLSKQGGHIMPTTLLLGTHRFSDLPTALPELLQYTYMHHVYAVNLIYSEKATKFWKSSPSFNPM